MIKKVLVRFTACALTVLLMSSVCFAAEAVEKVDGNIDISAAEYEITPFTVGVSNAKADLSFSGADAICVLTMKANTSKANKAVMSVKLQKKSGSTYVTVKNWRDESVSADAAGYVKFQRRFTVFEHGTYRVKVDGKVYKGSSLVDSFSVTSTEKVY